MKYEVITMKTLNDLIAVIKRHPRYGEVGMILCHNGVVRGTSRDGREVSGLAVEVDWHKLKAVVARQKMRQGIIEILVEINEGRNLVIGDDVMFIVVAGDIRETVIAVLTDTLNEIKSTVTGKTEFFL
jgi:molybdopterin synthase catalytic subunit